MSEKLQLSVSPEEAADELLLHKIIASKLGMGEKGDFNYRLLRKSIDARSRDIKINLGVEVFFTGEKMESPFQFKFENITSGKEVVIVGTGPAGLFAALRCIELGLKPIVFERGKDVSSRKKDIAQIYRNNIVLPDSNYCFGEGGAGTFSDGKLYTRSNKRGDVDRVLHMLRYHGAGEEVIYETHPHIGTDKLPEIIKNIRNTIEACGGQIYFNSRLTDIFIKDSAVTGVEINHTQKVDCNSIILATGHSARDVFQLLHNKNITLEAKGFAVGVRVEHPQELIDRIQYHGSQNPFLPAASYSLAVQVNERGVYSFCMCPGGYIVPSATADMEMVVNGMSSSNRHTAFANSGMVVEVRPEDLGAYSSHGALAGLVYQEELERMAFQNGGKGQIAPAQRLTDFVKGRLSGSLPVSSYIPGLLTSPVHFWLPDAISQRLRKAFVEFDKRMRGYMTGEALVVGVESRSSSPIRIPRNSETLQHIQIAGLFPCGEGAGYAGGIVSSAMDGENVAEKVKLYLG